MSKKLILIRHGESLWNLQNKFAGWANIPLTNKGIFDSKSAGRLLNKNKIIPGISFTSIQKRSIDTNKFLLKEMGLFKKIPIKENWMLNERHYGKLTGHNRNNITWKGGYFDIPPIIDNFYDLDLVNVNNYNPEYGESYYMTQLRILPFWKYLQKFIINNQTPLVCAHKNSLKVLIKQIENIDNDDINKIEVPNSLPIVYYFDNKMNYIRKKII